MLRLRLINPYSLTALIFCCALGSGAFAADQQLLKIDINATNNITYVSGEPIPWEGWIVTGTGNGDTGIQSKTFTNGIKVGFRCPWFTTAAPVTIEGFTNAYWGSFAGDMAEVRDPGINQGDMTMIISYLAPGDYTLKTYHNPRVISPSLNNYMDVNDRVGAGPWVRRKTDFDQCRWVPSNAVILANPCDVNFTIPEINNDYQVAFVTSFKHRSPTDANIPTDWTRNVGVCGFELIAHTIRAAYGANPANETKVRWNTNVGNTYSLSWLAPDPYTPGDTLTYDVYFTTNSANLYEGTTTTPAYPEGNRIATGTALTTLANAVTLEASKDYYWRVDTWGLKDGSPFRTAGAVWHFDTKNAAPTLTLGLAQVSFPGRTVTLTATATDLDELPVGRTITYRWTDRNDDANDPNYSDVYGTSAVPAIFTAGYTTTSSVSFVLDPNAVHVGLSRIYRWRCEAYDGENTTTKDTTVVVANETRCQLAKRQGNYYNPATQDGIVYPAIKSAGDFNDDCLTDFKDLAIYARSWLTCQAVNSVCL